MTTLIVFGAKYLIVLVGLAAVAVIWWAGKRRISLFYVLLGALPLGYALARLAGLFYGHHQPFAEEGFTPLIPHAVDNSFPSDHTLISSIFASVAFLADRRAGLALWVLALLVGLSRVLAGVHYGVDVLASAVLAVAAVWVVQKILRHFGLY